ncbi:MAG TPA: hypothetical protein VFO40_04880 [Chthoniobacterales bacterium]|nr:hypothetical protein [Chthoniobacterales bacterium]
MIRKTILIFLIVLGWLALLGAIAVSAKAGDRFCPSSADIICHWNWSRVDGDYTIRQYQRLSDALDRENLQSRLDSFLSSQGY